MSNAASASERAAWIDRIAALPKALHSVLDGLDAGQLLTPYREGGWTVAQVVHHLADSHLNAYLRTRKIAHEDRPTLQPYEQDVWAATPDATTPQLSASLELLTGLHERWVQFLRGLPSAAWPRAGFHPERGDVTIASLVESYAEHGENHVAQIAGLRQRRGW